MTTQLELTRHAEETALSHGADLVGVVNMGPVGNTDETLSGLFAALIQGGRPIADAAVIVATSTRLMGLLCRPTAAFSVYHLLQRLEDAMVKVLKGTRKEG